MLTDPLVIRALGADGDGVAASADGGTVFLAATLPGETVLASGVVKRGPGWAADATVLEASADRVVPPCRHFGPCGGCAVQHMADGPYAAWKLGLLEEVVQKLGFRGVMPPLARTPAGARRRMELAVRRAPGGAILVGLHGRRSAEVVNMTECPVMHPALFRVVEGLRPVLRSLDGLKREGSVLMNLLDSGPDVLLQTDQVLSTADRTRLTALAVGLRLPRVSWMKLEGRPGAREAAEPACLLRPATQGFAGFTTPIPPGAFLQASLEGEAAVAAAVVGALPRLPGKARVVELFAGCGTLTHAIAAVARVEAFEGDGAAVAALRAARNPRVQVTVRDLARQPLQGPELKGAGAVVLDPPWGGALAQMPALAASGVPIVYVSCNPAALLRDGRVLVGAGYRVASVVGVDQFLWSARVEGVVGFVRG